MCPSAAVGSAKVVCTIGPASEDRETLLSLVEAGMSVARLNASHGTTADRRRIISRVRDIDRQTDRPLATLVDLSGPEVRTAPLGSPVALVGGETVTFAPGETVEGSAVGVSRPLGGVAPGDAVLLDDGRIETTVTGVDGESVTARVDSGGELGGRAGVNVPGVDLGLPVVTETDEAELDVAVEANADFVAASFVRSAEDVLSVSAAIEDRGADIPVVAKIERSDAVDNLDGIVAAADGVMVARGDLGVECPLERVPIIQKRIIRRCHRAGVPVITATEMLDSMARQRRPTRAEASDVANAVLDGTDAVMLSAETAVGDHPVRVVETMNRIVADVEASEEYDEAREQRVPPAEDTRTDALARSARYLARDVDATAIVAASESGYTARKAAKYRPSIPVVAATPDGRIRRQLSLSWGTIPRHAARAESADGVIRGAVQAALDTGVADPGDTVVVIAGMMTETEGLDTANILKVHVAAERLTAGRSVVAGTVDGPFYRAGHDHIGDLPDGAILGVPADLEGPFSDDHSTLGGIVDEHTGMTCDAAVLARELGVPMICGATLPDVTDGTSVSLDAERGVVYDRPTGGGRREGGDGGEDR